MKVKQDYISNSTCFPYKPHHSPNILVCVPPPLCMAWSATQPQSIAYGITARILSYILNTILLVITKLSRGWLVPNQNENSEEWVIPPGGVVPYLMCVPPPSPTLSTVIYLSICWALWIGLSLLDALCFLSLLTATHSCTTYKLGFCYLQCRLFVDLQDPAPCVLFMTSSWCSFWIGLDLAKSSFPVNCCIQYGVWTTVKGFIEAQNMRVRCIYPYDANCKEDYFVLHCLVFLVLKYVSWSSDWYLQPQKFTRPIKAANTD